MNKQEEMLEKMRDHGWKATNYITNPDEGVAFIMNAPGAVAILYPDGSLDRQMTPKSPIRFRDGYRDLRADARAKKREEQFNRKLTGLIELYYNQLRNQF